MQLVRFSVCGTALGFPVAAVREVVAVGRLALIFHAPAFVDGLMNVRGEPLPVFDLASLFGWPSGECKAPYVIMAESGRLVAGFRAAPPIDIVEVTPPTERIALPEGTSSMEAIDTVVQVDGCPLLVLHPGRLFNLPGLKALREDGEWLDASERLGRGPALP